MQREALWTAAASRFVLALGFQSQRLAAAANLDAWHPRFFLSLTFDPSKSGRCAPASKARLRRALQIRNVDLARDQLGQQQIAGATEVGVFRLEYMHLLEHRSLGIAEWAVGK